LDNNVKISIEGSDLAEGIDIMATKDIIILSGYRSPIETGITIAVPPRTYPRIPTRSEHAGKYAIDVRAGVVVKDYRGVIKVILINNPNISFQVQPGDRIAQLILEKILGADPKEMTKPLELIRGNQGFGL
jgi:deoxyuridine 5'-triphosphate nucleotidohydrolase